MKASVSRKSHFNAAHRLFNKNWSDEKNNAIFGKCANPNYHGHNYDLIVTVTGQIDSETGYVVDLKLLDCLIKKEVIERFDHMNLNLDTSEFRDLIPTADNIAYVIWNLLRKKIHERHHLKVTIYETERNCAEYSGE